MDITILEKDLDRRFRIIDIYPALLLNSDYSDILDSETVFYSDPDQLNPGQRVFTIYVQSTIMLFDVSSWLLKNGYKYIKFPKIINKPCDIDWSVRELMLRDSAYISINRPYTELKVVIRRKDFRKFVLDIKRMLSDLNAFNLYTVLKLGRAGKVDDNEIVLKGG